MQAFDHADMAANVASHVRVGALLSAAVCRQIPAPQRAGPGRWPTSPPPKSRRRDSQAPAAAVTSPAAPSSASRATLRSVAGRTSSAHPIGLAHSIQSAPVTVSATPRST